MALQFALDPPSRSAPELYQCMICSVWYGTVCALE